jgi:hypothetical protein
LAEVVVIIQKLIKELLQKTKTQELEGQAIILLLIEVHKEEKVIPNAQKVIQRIVEAEKEDLTQLLEAVVRRATIHQPHQVRAAADQVLGVHQVAVQVPAAVPVLGQVEVQEIAVAEEDNFKFNFN